MRVTARSCASRPGRLAVSLATVVACVLVVGLTGCSQPSGTAAAAATRASRPSTYALMQMNLCLSGVADCYVKVAYPDVLQEAVARIRELHPDAVTFNEACRNDVSLIARRTAYHLRFAVVIYDGKPLPCVHPGGRGVFGDAVLTRAPIQSTDSGAFNAQAGPERRVWLCVRTRVTDVCTAHLASNEIDELAANGPECDELRALLGRRATAHTVIFGGDLNRSGYCAPDGFWTRSDASAHQDPGLQHVYGAGALNGPSAEVVPARHTDHDILLVRAHLR